MPFALFVNDVATQLFDEDPDLQPSLVVREVSGVDGFALGWVVKEDGSYGPPPEPEVVLPPPAPLITFKADLWRRATDEEAVQMDEALHELPVRLRRMYEDSQHIGHGDEFFPALSEGLIGLFGEARASELLLASN